MESSNTKAEKWTAPTQSEIDAWKEKHGADKLSLITVDDPKTGKAHEAYFRTPRLKDIEAAMKDAKVKNSDIAMSKRLYLDCKLSVDPVIEENDEMLMSVYGRVGELVNIAESTIKKL